MVKKCRKFWKTVKRERMEERRYSNKQWDGKSSKIDPLTKYTKKLQFPFYFVCISYFLCTIKQQLVNEFVDPPELQWKYSN